MNEIKLSNHDLQKISDLHRKIPEIVRLFKCRDENANAYREYRKCYYGKLNYDKIHMKELKAASDSANLQYFDAMEAWKKEIKVIIEKYQYTTLNNFLSKYPSKEMGIEATHKFAKNIRLIAESYNIPIIQTLYSGAPLLVNNYPTKWLETIYERVEY